MAAAINDNVDNTTKPAKKTKAVKLQASKKKKPAAKAKTVAADPAPITETFSVRATMIADIPSVPELRRSLIDWAGGRGLPADREAACLAREMSIQQCHFCGGATDQSMNLRTPWSEVVLCECLDSAAVARPQTTTQHIPVTMGGPVPVVGGYHEFLPDWKARLPELIEKAKARILSPAESVYCNTCPCGTPFTVTVGMVTRSVDRHGSHMEMKKCKSCREALMAKAEAKAKGAREDAADHGHMGAISHAAKPKKKKGKALQPAAAPVAATTGDAGVTVGDVFGDALERLRAEAS